MSLTDIFFGTLAFVSCGKKPTSTVSLNCNFVSPGLQDDIIECEAKVTKATRKKFSQSWVFNILKRESTISPNEEIIRHNICNVELQPNICDI